MNYAEIIKGIDATINGLNLIKSAIQDSATDAPVTPMSMVAPASLSDSTDTPVIGKFDREQLSSMKYNEFKKLAASLGVKCTGTRDEILDRIMALDIEVTSDDAVVSEPVEEDATPKKTRKSKKVDTPADEEVDQKKSDKPSKGKRNSSKKTSEDTRDEFDEQAEKIAQDTDAEDIITALKDVDVKATKHNYVEKLAYALREGLVETEDDEDEDEEEPDETDEDVVEEEDNTTEDEIEADSYFPQYDPKGFNDPKGKNMTEERHEAIVSLMDGILTDVSEDTLTSEDIEHYIEDNATEEEIDLLGDEYDDNELLKLYMELKKRTIDNDGEEHEEEDPYEVGEHDMCCGHELKYSKKTKKYICEHCGTEYEAE